RFKILKRLKNFVCPIIEKAIVEQVSDFPSRGSSHDADELDRWFGDLSCCQGNGFIAGSEGIVVERSEINAKALPFQIGVEHRHIVSGGERLAVDSRKDHSAFDTCRFGR